MEIIKGKSFILREPKISDVESLAGYLSHKEVKAGARLFEKFDIDDAKEWVEKVLVSNSKKKGLRVIIEIQNEAVGGITFKDFRDGSAELGYWLAKPFWGRGIMSEAVELFIKLGFEKFNLKEIYAWASDSNLASVRVLEKVGFIQKEKKKGELDCSRYVIDKHFIGKK